MEVSDQVLVDLLKQGERNSTKLDSTLSAVESINDRIDGLTKNMKEMHKELGSKASLAQHWDHETRINAIELRQKIKQSWFNSANWLLKRFRDIIFICTFLVSCLYMIEKRDAMYTFFTSQKQS